MFANGEVYFTAEVNKVIGHYSPTEDTVDWLLGTGQDDTHMLVISKSQEIFTANIGSDSVSAIRQSANQRDWTEVVIPVEGSRRHRHITGRDGGLDGSIKRRECFDHQCCSSQGSSSFISLNTKR